MDKTPQRVLVHELKRALDLIPRDRGAVTRVRQIIKDNPRSVRSSHVLRNIGQARVARLAYVIGEPLAPARVSPLRHDATRYSSCDDCDRTDGTHDPNKEH